MDDKRIPNDQANQNDSGIAPTTQQLTWPLDWNTQQVLRRWLNQAIAGLGNVGGVGAAGQLGWLQFNDGNGHFDATEHVQYTNLNNNPTLLVKEGLIEMLQASVAAEGVLEVYFKSGDAGEVFPAFVGLVGDETEGRIILAAPFHTSGTVPGMDARIQPGYNSNTASVGQVEFYHPGLVRSFFFPLNQLTGSRTITFQDANGTVAFLSDITTPSTDFDDEEFSIHDNGDATKKVQFEVSGVATTTTRVVTVQNSDGTMAYLSDIPDITLQSGTYTPTRSAEANLDSNVTMTAAQYMRVGDTVTVSGRFTANPTAAGAASFEIDLPIASNIGAAEHVAGVAFCGGVAGQGAEIIGVAANDTAKFQWIAVDLSSKVWSYSFTYQVI